jgi:hypothetical protein
MTACGEVFHFSSETGKGGGSVRMEKSAKKRIFRLFARGNTPEQVVESLNDPAAVTGEGGATPPMVERLFHEYLSLSLGEKLRLTLMTECVADRLHRLMDDLSDLQSVDALLSEADEKALVSLLDVKRKIKERMAKESAQGSETRRESGEDATDHEIDEYYEKIFAGSPPQA